MNRTTRLGRFAASLACCTLAGAGVLGGCGGEPGSTVAWVPEDAGAAGGEATRAAGMHALPKHDVARPAHVTPASIITRTPEPKAPWSGAGTAIVRANLAGDASVMAAPGNAGATTPSSACGNYDSNTFGASDACRATQTYSCGAEDLYEIDCTCPAATCTCMRNGEQVGSVALDACPSCAGTQFERIAAACGVAH